jgi:transposase
MSTKDRLATVAEGRYWREADARVIVDSWQASQETLAQFARHHGLDRRRLSRWVGRLGRIAPAPVRFHPVRVARDGGVPRGGGAPIEIAFGTDPQGRVVRVAPGFAADDLRRVLALLAERPPC